MSLSIKEALLWGVGRLEGKRKQLECEILLASVLQVDRVFLHTFDERILDLKQLQTFEALIARASCGEPIEYLTQKAGFYGYEFDVVSGVLIPRPETEILVQKVQELVIQKQIKQVFELGVGSGVISIVLALLCPDIKVIATDINPLALKLARQNIQKFLTQDLSLDERIVLLEIDVLKEDFDFGGVELFISNPPYIARDYILPKNVSYEPESALFGGERGDEVLLEIIALVEKMKIPFLACEMGYNQKESMQEALRGRAKVDFYCDLNKHNRGFIASFLQ